MHYYIDGYNLLFRLIHATSDLQTPREYLIEDINKKATLLNLDVTLVFDSTFQLSEATRSHYRHIEILFTDHGETADQHIVEEVKKAKGRVAVITSDKRLAAAVRHLGAQTESVEAFWQRINKSYRKKAYKPAKIKLPPPLPPQPPPLPTDDKRPDDYESIFEARYKKLMEDEPLRARKEIDKLQKKKKARKAPPPPKGNDMERWLKAFEERLKGD